MEKGHSVFILHQIQEYKVEAHFTHHVSKMIKCGNPFQLLAKQS